MQSKRKQHHRQYQQNRSNPRLGHQLPDTPQWINRLLAKILLGQLDQFLHLLGQLFRIRDEPQGYTTQGVFRSAVLKIGAHQGSHQGAKQFVADMFLLCGCHGFCYICRPGHASIRLPS